jgi:hypothetical protein
VAPGLPLSEREAAVRVRPGDDHGGPPHLGPEATSRESAGRIQGEESESVESRRRSVNTYMAAHPKLLEELIEELAESVSGAHQHGAGPQML